MVTRRNLNAIQIISPFLKVRICYVIGFRKTLSAWFFIQVLSPFGFIALLTDQPASKPTKLKFGHVEEHG